ncbi:signal recognition particle receptor subunit alpha, partial [Bartonella sp. M0187]|uniref:signal recognition particle receptor subunit alpha n=1 Tax=Bartonella apihabitans TaxID=2750929 RepID=UPI0018DAFB39
MAKGLFKKVFSFGSNPKTDSEPEGTKDTATPALSPFEAYKAAQAKEQNKTASTEKPAEPKQERPNTPSENQKPALAEKKKKENQPAKKPTVPEAEFVGSQTVETAETPSNHASEKTVTITDKVTRNENKVIKPDLLLHEPKKMSWFERLKTGLARSSRQLGDSISSIFTKRKLDEATLQDLEDVLIQADLGLETAIRITDTLASSRYGKDISTDEVRTIMSDEIKKV